MTKGEIRAGHALAGRAISRGAQHRDVIRVLQDEWRVPSLRFRKADDDEPDKAQPGAHGIPEIARQEQAFFNALTDGQKDAYRALAEMVDTLYTQGQGWTGVDPWKIGEPIDEWKRNAFVNLATNPMQAFMVGQMLANEALNGVISRPLLPTDRRAIEFLEHTTFNEIDSTFEDLKTLLRANLIAGMKSGANPKDVAREMAATLDNYGTDFALLTITETTRADAQGRLHELQDAGVEWCIGSSAHDSRTCPSCLEMIDGQKYRVADVIDASNYKRKRAEWVACIPLHPRCRCVWLPYHPDTAAILAGTA